ncbi:MAG: hypothetical protein NTY77_15865 [Elusimicrobia bacterium]|nr:hypothetical protein [Elusimicrobiota bacterium]
MTPAQDRLRDLLTIVEKGRYEGAAERAVLAHLGRCAAPEDAQLDWRRLFSALVCARRYAAAFRLGEFVLDRPWGAAASHAFRWPWWLLKGGSVNDRTFCSRELARLRRAPPGARTGPWAAYLRALLSFNLGRPADTLAESRRVAAVDPGRYAWMRQAFVQLKLEAGDFAAARGLCRGILRRFPEHWWARCRLAQVHLLERDRTSGWRQFRRAEAGAAAEDLGDVLTAHAEALLWLGRYRAALAKLDEAWRRGSRSFVLRCRGAARLKLGEPRQALRDLDAAIAADPRDFEAYIWRGAANRVLGRHARALRDLDVFVAFAPDCLLGRLERALARLDAGDAPGAAADLRAVRRRDWDLLGARLGPARPRDRRGGRLRRYLLRALDLARGVRSHEPYLRALWLRGARRKTRVWKAGRALSKSVLRAGER